MTGHTWAVKVTLSPRKLDPVDEVRAVVVVAWSTS